MTHEPRDPDGRTDALDVLDVGSGYGPRSVRLPLTPPQRRAWFGDRRSPGGPSYIIPRAYRLRGSLDGDALARALDVLVSRHRALRTTFALFEGSPVQMVAARGMASYSRRELNHAGPEGRLAAARRLLQREARRRFDLERGPLLRAALLDLASDDHLLLLAAPAIAADEWSLGVLWRELGQVYSALLKGGSAVLSPGDDRLAEVESRAAGAVSNAEHTLDELWWEEALRGAVPALLPREIGEGPGRGPALASAHARVEKDHAGRLRALARDEKASLFMVLVAALAALMRRMTDRTDILIGARTVHRPHPDFEALVGPYAATLLIRVAAAGRLTFRELVRHVRDATLDAHAHAGPVPLGGDPLASLTASVSFDDGREELPGFAAIEASRFPVAAPMPHAGLDVRFRLEPAGLECSISHLGDWPSGAAVEQLVGLLTATLADVGAAPDTPVDSTPRASTGDRRMLLSLGRGPVLPLPHTDPLAIVHDRALRSPGSVVLHAGERQRSLCEISTDAAAAARGLARLGVEPGAFVGIRSADALQEVALTLGALAAGAVCIQDPGEFGTHVPEVVIADNSVGAGSRLSPADLLELGNGRPTGPSASDAGGLLAPGDGLHSSNLVHSTAALVNAALWHRGVFPVRHDEATWASNTRPADSAIALLAGGSVHVGRDEDVAEDLTHDRVKWALVGRRHLVQVLDKWATGATRPGQALRGLIVATDNPAAGVAERFREVCRAVRRSDISLHFVSGGRGLYLPAIHWQSRAHFDNLEFPGRPVANTRIYVVNDAGALCPRGLPGEIWVGGAPAPRVVQGANDPAVGPDPFTRGGRVYRTGIRARWTSAGRLQWLGRVTDSAGDALEGLAGRVVDSGAVLRTES